jgi:hypothetical protein
MATRQGQAALRADTANILPATERFNMMSEHPDRSNADLGSEAVEEMAKYGIKCAWISQFSYGDYHYTNLADAIAEAQRHPRAG